LGFIQGSVRQLVRRGSCSVIRMSPAPSRRPLRGLTVWATGSPVLSAWSRGVRWPQARRN